MRSLAILFVLLALAGTSHAQDDHPDTRTTSATPLAADGATVPGTIEVGGDRDWFRVPLTSGTTYSVFTTALGAGMDSVISVYTPRNTTVGTDDNGGGGLASRVTFVASATGFFYVRLVHASATGTGTYELGVTSGGGSPPVVTRPAAPAGVAAQALGTGRIDLTWTDASTDETSFSVDRRRAGQVSYATVGSVPADATAFSDVTVLEGTTYEYRVFAGNVAGRSGSAIVSATTWPVPPTDVRATGVWNDGLDLAWTDASAGETAYEVERRAPGGVFVTLGGVAADAVTYGDRTTSEATTYEYRVSAVNAGGRGPSAVLSVVTAPAPPTNVVAVAATTTRIDLTWTDASAGETGYRIDRYEPGQIVVTVATLGANATAFADTTVAPNTQYTYRVWAVGPGGETSRLASASTLVIAAPASLFARPRAPMEVELQWSDRASNEAGYRLERRVAATSSTPAGAFAAIATLPADTTWFVDRTLPAPERYDYRVLATDGAIDSLAAQTTVAVRVPGPTSPMAVSGSATRIFLSWTDNATTETGFTIYRNPSLQTLSFEAVGTTGPDVTSFTDTTVEPGRTYEYAIYATSGALLSPPSDRVRATTPPAPPPPPLAPAAGLRAAAGGPFRIDLTWLDESEGETGFRIERRAPGGAFTTLATTAAQVSAYPDASVAPGTTCEYRVIAVGAAGDAAPSEVASASTPPAVGAIVNGDFQVGDLRGWTPYGPLALRVVQFATISAPGTLALHVHPAGQLQAGGVSQVVTLAAGALDIESRVACFVPYPTSAGGVASLVVDGVVVAQRDFGGPLPGNQVIRTTLRGALPALAAGAHEVRLRVEGAGEVELYFDNVRLSGTAVPVRPLAPASLTLASVGPGGVALAWSDRSSDELGFRIERGVAGGGGFVEVGRAPADATTFTDPTTISTGRVLTYRVFATNGAGDSTASNVVSTPSPGAPASPGGLAATTAQGVVRLSWADGPTETALRVERRLAGGVFTVVGRLAADTTSYTDATVEPSVDYEYRVVATNDAGEGASAVAVMSAAPTPSPLEPTGLMGHAVGPNQVELSWIDNATDEVGYRVERHVQTGFTAWELLATLPASATTFTDRGARAGASHAYRVSAVGVTGLSFPAVVEVATPVLPGPTDLRAGLVLWDRVELAWVDHATWETGFRVERRLRDGTWAALLTVTTDVTSAVDTSAALATEYEYRVVAETAGGESAPSNTVLVRTPAPAAPAAPTDLRAVASAPTRVDLTWVDPATTETGFRVERRRGANRFRVLAAPPVNTTAYTDTTALPGCTYEYRVLAVNAGGPSNAAHAQVAGVTTPAGGALKNGDFEAGDARCWTATDGAALRVTPFDVDGDGVASWALTTEGEATARQGVILAAGRLDLRVDVAASSRWSGRNMGALELLFDGVVVGRHHFGEQLVSQGRGTIQASVADVAAGPHEVRLAVRGALNETNQFIDHVVLSGSAVPAPPAAPTTLTITSATAGRVDLAWADASRDEAGFRIERSARGGGSFVEIGRVGRDVTSFADAAVPAGAACEYRVIATNVGGESAPSNVAGAPLPARPSAATSLVASTTGAALVTLSWSDRSTNELGFLVERRPAGGWRYAQLAVVAPNATSFQDTSATPFTGYDYRVIAFNDAGEATPARASATTGGLRLAPAAPVGLAAVSSPEGVLLTWTGADDLGVRLERRLTVPSWSSHTPPFSAIGLTAGGASSYVDATAERGVTYVYRCVRAHAGSESPASAEADGTYSGPPATPTGLWARALDPLRVLLGWTDAADDESGYRLERRPVGTTAFVGLTTTLTRDAEGWLDTDLLPGQSMEYRVVATAPDGAPSGVAGATTPPTLLVNGDFERGDLQGWTPFWGLDSPVFSAAHSDTDGDGTTSWCARISRATGQSGLLQHVELAAGDLELSVAVQIGIGYDGTYSLLFDGVVVATYAYTNPTGRGVLRASLPSVAAGRHELRVRVERLGGAFGAPTYDIDDVTLSGSAVPPRPVAATGLSATRVGGGVLLTWTDLATNERGFRVERSPAGGGSFLEVARAPADATSFLDATAAAGVAYEYRVFATNERGDSASTGVAAVP